MFYVYGDHLGSTALLTYGLTAVGDDHAAAGDPVPNTLARYTPFGDWRTEPTAGLTDRGYTGHRQNNTGSGPGDIGLIYMNARYYLPEVGRFASADTLVPDPSNPQQYNRYSYVLNSPLSFTDPSGHCITPSSFVLCIALLATTVAVDTTATIQQTDSYEAKSLGEGKPNIAAVSVETNVLGVAPYITEVSHFESETSGILACERQCASFPAGASGGISISLGWTDFDDPHTAWEGIFVSGSVSGGRYSLGYSTTAVPLADISTGNKFPVMSSYDRFMQALVAGSSQPNATTVYSGAIACLSIKNFEL